MTVRRLRCLVKKGAVKASAAVRPGLLGCVQLLSLQRSSSQCCPDASDLLHDSRAHGNTYLQTPFTRARVIQTTIKSPDKLQRRAIELRQTAHIDCSICG